jgi:hypothetical protein
MSHFNGRRFLGPQCQTCYLTPWIDYPEKSEIWASGDKSGDNFFLVDQSFRQDDPTVLWSFGFPIAGR